MITTHSIAQNKTVVEPSQCYLAKAYQSNLGFVSAYSTTVYALARALQPGLTIFNNAMKPRRISEKTSRFLAGVLSGFHSLEGQGSVLLNGLQVMSTLSLLAPMYWYPYAQLANAECEHAKSLTQSPNKTNPLECYLADAHDGINVFEVAYAWGLYVGVYMVLPFLLKSITRWTKGCCSSEEPVTSIPEVVAGDSVPKFVSAASQTEDPQAPGVDILGGGLNAASMTADKYSLVDVGAWTMVIAYITPMIFFGLSYPAREKCNFALANRTIAP